jgi:hypothetical protein
MGKSLIVERMRSQQGKILISIIWGIGIACLFFKTCKGRSCITIKAPRQEVVSGMVHHHNKSCFEFQSKESECINDVIKEIEEEKKSENNK